MADLYGEACEPCRSGAPLLSKVEIEQLLLQLPAWEINEIDGVQRLVRSIKFKTFKQALAFTNHLGALAETHQHHPAILTEWGKVTVNWWTHKKGGLHRNDFVMAARTDQLLVPES